MLSGQLLMSHALTASYTVSHYYLYNDQGYMVQGSQIGANRSTIHASLVHSIEIHGSCCPTLYTRLMVQGQRFPIPETCAGGLAHAA